MKIKFLGTSAGWPLPRLGCNCKICTSPDPKDKRLRPSVLVNDSLLIDCGPDIYHELIIQQSSNITISNLKALVITHAHPDHILGFHDLTHLYNHRSDLKLFMTLDTQRELRRCFSFPTTPFRPIIIKPEKSFEIDNLKITLIPVEHAKFPTCGVKIKGNKLLGYFPDFSKFLPSQEKTCRDLQLLVMDGSSLTTAGQSRNHQNIIQGLALGKKLKAKEIYFTHLGHKTGRYEYLENFVQIQGGKSYHIAYDGLELVI